MRLYAASFVLPRVSKRVATASDLISGKVFLMSQQFASSALSVPVQSYPKATSYILLCRLSFRTPFLFRSAKRSRHQAAITISLLGDQRRLTFSPSPVRIKLSTAFVFSLFPNP